jgi:hypothetical protein
MNLGRRESPTGRGRIVRVVAWFLLVYSLADIVCPQYCCEEMLSLYNLGDVSVASADDGASACAVNASRGPEQDQNSGAVPGDEDCFCRNPVPPSRGQAAHTGASQAVVHVFSAASVMPHSPLFNEVRLTFHDPPAPSAFPLTLNKSIRC